MRDDPRDPTRILTTARPKPAQYAPPPVRLGFSQRLRALRAARGFKRARAFANALDLEENRYTRYERAEVEPTLTVLCRMCDLLEATPNDLLGFDPPNGGRTTASSATASLASAQEALAWQLASAITALRDRHGDSDIDTDPDPIAAQRRTAAVFRTLKANPLETACAIIDDPVLERVDTRSRAAFADLVQAYTAKLSAAAAPDHAD